MVRLAAFLVFWEDNIWPFLDKDLTVCFLITLLLESFVFRKLSAKACGMAAWTAPIQPHAPSEHTRLWCWLIFMDQKLKTRTRGKGSTIIQVSFRKEQSGDQRNQPVRESWPYFRAHEELIPGSVSKVVMAIPRAAAPQRSTSAFTPVKTSPVPLSLHKALTAFFFFLHPNKEYQNLVIEKLAVMGWIVAPSQNHTLNS